MAIHDVECCEECAVHDEVVQSVRGMLPDDDDLYDMTQSAISHQLRILKQSQLVKSRRDGKSVFYSLADDHVYRIINQGFEHIKE